MAIQLGGCDAAQGFPGFCSDGRDGAGGRRRGAAEPGYTVVPVADRLTIVKVFGDA
jgi:hypothetical protein